MYDALTKAEFNTAYIAHIIADSGRQPTGGGVAHAADGAKGHIIARITEIMAGSRFY